MRHASVSTSQSISGARSRRADCCGPTVGKAEAKALLAKGVSRQGAQGRNMTMKMSFSPPSLNRQQC
jgi:hypothetical protein